MATRRRIRIDHSQGTTSAPTARVLGRRQRITRNDISRQSEDTIGISNSLAEVVLQTPYDLQSIAKWFEQSNILRQCVDAMVTNIAKQGYRAIPAEADMTMDPDEKKLLESFIESPNIDETFVGLNSKKLADYEKYGFGFIEVIRDARKRPALLRHAHAYKVRVMGKSGEAIPVTTSVTRGGRRSNITEMKRFRRYVQQTGTRRVYFKEFGDPRTMDYENGRYASSEYKVPKDRVATELLHHRQYSEDSYGLPRWISQLPSILGSREAEEVNLRYFEDNTVPPMLLSVAGGRLTRQSFDDLDKLLKSQGVGKDRQNQILLIEAIPETSGLDDKGSVSLQVDKLADVRPSDGLFQGYDDANISKIRSSFRLPPVVIGMSQDVTFACYDEDTETLTDRGWVRLNDWENGMQVACYDEANRSIGFHPPEDGLLVYDVENVDMYRIRTQQQDILVTPKHRMLSATAKEGEWGIVPIETVYAKRHRSYFRTSGQYDGGTATGSNTIVVPDSDYRGGIASLDDSIGHMPSSVFMEWLGYYLADGYVAQNGNAIRIGAKKSRKVARFTSLHEDLEDCGFRVRATQEVSGTYFTVSHKGMVNWITEQAGEGSEGKRIPQMVYQYSVDDLRILFDAMMFCDGTWDSREGRSSGSYSTVSLELADSFQMLAVLLGYRAILREDRPGSFGFNPVYRVMLSDRDTCQVLSNRHISREQYTGKVYCFSVPTGVFITRRNGKVAFQGNTANVSAYLAESQVFQPERDTHDEYFNKGFVNHPQGLNLKTVKLESKGPMVTNPDQIIKMLTAVNVMGGVTPRSAIDTINETMQLTLPQFPKRGEENYEEWMDVPMMIGQKMIVAKTQQTGEGTDPDGQRVKNDDIKDREDDGATGVDDNAVENGQQ